MSIFVHPKGTALSLKVDYNITAAYLAVHAYAVKFYARK